MTQQIQNFKNTIKEQISKAFDSNHEVVVNEEFQTTQLISYRAQSDNLNVQIIISFTNDIWDIVSKRSMKEMFVTLVNANNPKKTMDIASGLREADVETLGQALSGVLPFVI